MAQEPRLEFKGLYLHQPMSELRQDRRIGCNAIPKRFPSDEQCGNVYGLKETIAGASIESLLLLVYDGTVHKILIMTKASDFAGVQAALQEKYGAPTSNKIEPLTTRAGVTYENQSSTWLLSEGTIRIEKFSGRIDRSSVSFSSHQLDGLFKSRQEAAAKAGAKDL